jgi:hypothetical protein
MEGTGETYYGGDWRDILWRGLERHTVERTGETYYGEDWRDVVLLLPIHLVCR